MSGKAEARLIYNSISTSDRVASLGAKGALIYTWLITHCDSQGRMPGKPKIVKHQVVPFIEEINLMDITKAFRIMEDNKLVFWYKDDDERQIIQVNDWWTWQTGLRYKSASRYKSPEGWEDIVTPRNDEGRFIKVEAS